MPLAALILCKHAVGFSQTISPRIHEFLNWANRQAILMPLCVRESFRGYVLIIDLLEVCLDQVSIT